MPSRITIEPSTTIPKSIAPRLIRLADTPNTLMSMNPKSIAHGDFHWHRNQLLHLLRSQCGRYGDNLHLIVRDIGHGIHGQRQHRPNTAYEQKQCHQRDEEFLSDRKPDNSLKHIILFQNYLAKVAKKSKSRTILPKKIIK